ncbi:small integral membrane protein 10-like protein 2B isoform X1 [Mesocricetus auratus]|uniref:Small integral membrane protein 10-like protein 2B isoform X1 n=1 Tax=Mesocricetus auratus TaxID=10036 RepID=A0ABM2XCP9_MESAU|nr:small integral membrane protein 10-like protein 2B isoform X1 [Mesocricetus auratus]
MQDRGWPRGAPRPRRGAQAGRPGPLHFRPPRRAQGTASHTAKNLPSPVLFRLCVQRITRVWQTCCLPLAESGGTRKRGCSRRIYQALCRKSFLRCNLNPERERIGPVSPQEGPRGVRTRPCVWWSDKMDSSFLSRTSSLAPSLHGGPQVVSAACFSLPPCLPRLPTAPAMIPALVFWVMDGSPLP